MLTIRDGLPEGFLAAGARDLHRLLPGPTLLHLPGRRNEPLFASILLHGNEDTGLRAVQMLLAAHAGRELPRALSIFIGNVSAAAAGLRRLDGQPDYNRVWPGADSPATAEHAMALEVVEAMHARRVFASIDIHNNTGLNPHYACIPRLEQAFLHLAQLFSRIVVVFQRPLGVQATAFAALCPAVTLECGKVGAAAGDEHAACLLDAALRLDHFPAHAVPARDVDVYRTVATVKVPEEIAFGFAGEPAALRFDSDLDHMNFRDLAPGTRLARFADGNRLPLDVRDDAGNEVGARYFALAGGELRTRRPVTPAMLTLDARIIRQDCLCYLMERVDYAPAAQRG